MEIGKKSKICVVWKVKPTDYSEEGKKNIIAAMAAKYGIDKKNIIVSPEYLAEGQKKDVLNSENIESIHDPQFQQELFKRYLEENKIEGYDFDEIIKIDSQINSLIDYDSYEKSKSYKIKWVKWDNFLSYGEGNFFDFEKLHGLILLNGIPENESGKSTFAYDLLHFLLFGKTQTDKANTQKDLFNNYLPEATNVIVEGCIELDGNDYIIKRTLTRPALSKKTKNRAVSAKVEYYQLNQDGSKEELEDTTNLQEHSSRKTSQIIKEALGNEADFDRIISANSKDLDSLISMKDTERGRLLSKWIGLSILEDKDALAREKWNKEISKKRFCDIYNTETLNNEIIELTGVNTEHEKEITGEESKITDSKNRISEYEKNRSKLMEARQSVDPSLTKIDITTLQKSIDRIIAEGNNSKNTIATLKSQIESYGEINVKENEYSDLRKENENIISQMASLNTEIKNLQSTNKTLANAEYCPTCGRKFDNVDNSGKIKENNEQIEAKVIAGKNLRDRKNTVEEQMRAIESDRQRLQEKNRIEIKLSALNAEIANQRAEYTEKKRTMDSLIKNKEAIEQNNKIDAMLYSVNESIRTEEGIVNNATYQIAYLKKDIESNIQKINDKKSLIMKIEEERKIEKNWKVYLQMIGKDGISKMVLRNSLPIINGELDRLLDDVADFDIEISINDKNDIEFWLLRDNIKTRLSAASGLERTEASLALRVVLGKMSRLSRPPFLLLDEVLGTVGKSSYDNMKKLYDKIATSYDFILHITHLADIVDWHDSIVTVQKINNISSIVQP